MDHWYLFAVLIFVFACMMLSFLRWCLSFLIPTKTIHASPRPLHPIDPVSDDSPFDSLPHEIVGTIFGKLSTGDRARTRLVCKSWRDRLMRANFPVEPEPPWLILSNDCYDEPQPFLTEVSFESVFEERKYTFTLPKSACTTGRWRWWCCGSPGKGWLLMSGRLGPDLKTTVMMLWDPLSGATVKLPPLSTLPFFGGLMEGCLRLGLPSLSLHTLRAQLISFGGSPVAVAVLFADGRNLARYHVALCSPHDRGWRSVRGARGESCKDILFHRGKLYVLYSRQDIMTPNNSTRRWFLSSVIERERHAIGLGCGDVEVIKLELVYEDLNPAGDLDVDEDRYPIGFNIRKRWYQAEQLVEPCTSSTSVANEDELLVVTTVLDMTSYIDGNGGQRPGPIPVFMSTQIGGFEVRRLKMVNENGLCSLEKKTDRIGEQCIFMGTSGSTSVDGVDAECIHFAMHADLGYFVSGADDDDDSDSDDEEDYVDDDEEEEHGDDHVNNGLHDDIIDDENKIVIHPKRSYFVNERGVFYVPHGKVNRISATSASVRSGFCTGWFTPNLN